MAVDDAEILDADAGETDEESLFDDGAQHRQFILRRDLRKRVDVYLHNRLGNISRNRVQKLIDLGGVTVNGKIPKASTLLRVGNVLDVILPPPAVRQILPENIPLTIVYEDRQLLVVNKQANLIVHPARGNLSGTLINALAFHFMQGKTGGAAAAAGGADSTGSAEVIAGAADAGGEEEEGRVAGLSTVGAQEFRPGIVHRLDRYTTGLMVVAKSDEAHWQLARQFEERRPRKIYLALVHGGPEEPGGIIDQPLGKHPTIREAYAVRHDSSARACLTIYRVRQRYRGYSLLELELKTGRTHQIRVHLSYMGWPIVGDIIYGGEAVGPEEIENPQIPAGARQMLTFARERAEGQRLEAAAAARGPLVIAHPCLHAAHLCFSHPLEGHELSFTAALHQPLAGLIRQLQQYPQAGQVADSGYWIDLEQVLPK